MKPNIDPKVDCVFKAMLGSEAHKSLLVHFLNAVLSRDPGIHIRDVELQNPYNEREFETDKLSVVDVKARDDQERSYQIEIQLALHEGLTSRMLYTWSTMYHALIQKGKDFSELKPVIAIWLLNETLFDAPGAWHLPFIVWNREHAVTLSDDFRIHVLQLPLWQRRDQAQDDLDRWMYLFTEGEDVDAASPPAILQTDEMQEAISVLQRFSENERQYLLYQQRLEAEYLRATWQNAIARAERHAAEAERHAEDAKRQAAETVRQATERAKQREDEAKQQIEQERREKERLLALLKQAGIDPKIPS